MMCSRTINAALITLTVSGSGRVGSSALTPRTHAVDGREAPVSKCATCETACTPASVWVANKVTNAIAYVVWGFRFEMHVPVVSAGDAFFQVPGR